MFKALLLRALVKNQDEPPLFLTGVRSQTEGVSLLKFDFHALRISYLHGIDESVVWHARVEHVREFVLAQKSFRIREFGPKFGRPIDPSQHLPRGPTLEWPHINRQA